ncbi:MAG: gliding motility-associated C-terminal domain-containing protein [bacterium]
MQAWKCIFGLFVLLNIMGFIPVAAQQYLQNPSLEGIPGFEMIPPGWQKCDPESTPDTGPVEILNVNNPPSEGSSYVHMVTRDTIAPYSRKYEEIHTSLLQSLEKGSCYRFKADLAMCPSDSSFTFNHGMIKYNNPVVLNIYGGVNYCERTELLAVVGPVTNTSWQTYEITIQPTLGNYPFLILEVYFAGDEHYFGNMLIDNLFLDDVPLDEIVVMDTTVQAGDLVYLSASAGSYYEWMPLEGLNCYDCQTPVFTGSQNEFYSCYVEQEGSCPWIEKFNIDIRYFIPNVITPNDDGRNDRFYIPGLPKGSLLTISDRDGQVIFISEDYENNWAGYSGSNQRVESGTYWYVLKIPGLNKPVSGFIYVMH